MSKKVNIKLKIIGNKKKIIFQKIFFGWFKSLFTHKMFQTLKITNKIG